MIFLFAFAVDLVGRFVFLKEAIAKSLIAKCDA